MTDLLKMGQAILASQPFSQFLGAEITGFGPDMVEITLPLRPEFQQQNGFAHGGVVSYLADNALTFAGGLALGPKILTSEFKINYLRPALGRALVARARPAAAGKRQAVCTCEIFAIAEDGTQKMCAIAQGTIAAT